MEYNASRVELGLNTDAGRQELQQARLQATTGHVPEALAAYEKAFNSRAAGRRLCGGILEHGGENSARRMKP